MWFSDALATGFRHPTDLARLQTYRILFGTVLTLRFALTFGQGGWTRFAPTSLSTALMLVLPEPSWNGSTSKAPTPSAAPCSPRAASCSPETSAPTRTSGTAPARPTPGHSASWC
ncbi:MULTISPECIES: hypothetical protein [Streptomyces]|uniref:Uncharacterized protein n=2 Tax=Streptomyces TaxID=1883 RepID=A0ABV9J6N5_9ACTN